nr:hypothetical protein [Rhodospirillales bacterium]
MNVDVNNGKNTYEYYETEHGDYWKVTNDPAYYYTDTDTDTDTDTNKIKTQAKRMVDIPVRVERINTKMQAYFKEQGSVWQYYQLIDTQYPVYQNEKPATSTETDYHIPESVINKPGGKPNLALLTNITMETFFQGGNQVSGLMENSHSDITILGQKAALVVILVLIYTTRIHFKKV